MQHCTNLVYRKNIIFIACKRHRLSRPLLDDERWVNDGLVGVPLGNLPANSASTVKTKLKTDRTKSTYGFGSCRVYRVSSCAGTHIELAQEDNRQTFGYHWLWTDGWFMLDGCRDCSSR